MKEALSRRLRLGVFVLCGLVLFSACKNVPRQSSGAEPWVTNSAGEELKSLQGYWEGVGAGGKCSITIAGNSLEYRAGTNWWKTTFTLPAGKNPQQLHATINDSSPPKNGIDHVVYAIFKIEGGTLTLGVVDGSDEASKSFADAPSRYVLTPGEDKKH